MENELIRVEAVQKSFRVHKREKTMLGSIRQLLAPTYEKKQAVNGLSFTIQAGEMVGFVGPNGSGKSTTVKMLSGILHPDAGVIEVAGYHPYRQRQQYVRNIGVVFGQKSQLSWDLPCIESFDLLKHIYRIPEELYQQNLARYSELLDLGTFINQPVRQLSLGQRMRADIAAALLHSPKIVFFDEPTIGVDVVGKEKIREFLVELNRTDHITMLFTTHDMKDIETTCKRLMIIDHGKKIYDGDFENLRNKYGSIKTLDILLDKRCEITPIPLTNSEYVIANGVEKLRITFQKGQIDVNQLMKQVLELYPVKDLSLQETEVETIIRDIYEGGV